MRNKARSLLIGLLVLAFVATTVNSEPRSGWPWPAGPSGGDFLDWVRAMAGGGPIPTRIEPSATVALPRHQVVPTGKATGPVTRVRELVELRTATTRFFQLSDGRVQAEVSADAAYYRDGQGHYQPIDTRVGATDDAGFRYANQTNTFASRFGGRSDALAVLDVAGHKLTMGVPGTSRDVAVTATGDTVRFPDAVAGADLSYQVTGTALRERLVLGRAPADPTFTFVVDAGGLAVDARPDGSVAFRAPDGDGTPLLVLPRPVLYDNRDDPSSPYGKAWSDRVTQTVHRDGDRLTVTVTADRGWLADPARAYPVTIDPTFEVGPALVRSQDATIGSGTPGANHANASHLPVGGTGSGAWRGLTRFDLSGVPAGTHLDSASLQLYHDGDLGTGDTAIEARQVSAAWDPATVTWGSVNARAGDPGVNRETVDDADAAKTAADGEWPQSVNEDHLRYGTGGGYTYHKNPAAGQTFSWVPRITEDGDYLVEAHYVAGPDRSPVAPYTVFFKGGQKTVTVNQSAGTGGVWAPLGTFPFVAGTSQKIVLGSRDGRAVIADSVRLTKAGTTAHKAGQAAGWSGLSVRSTVQDWLDGAAPNHGFMLKALDEKAGHGTRYGTDAGHAPKLVLTYTPAGTVLAPPATLYPTGAALRWAAYPGTDIVEYQVHRSDTPQFTPSAATLVAPVPPGTTTYTDTSVTPSTTDGQAYSYLVAVRLRDGTLLPAVPQTVKLPRVGRVVQILSGDTATDTTLTSDQPDTPHNTLDGQPVLAVAGGQSGAARSLLRFGDLSSVPTGARVIDAHLDLWSLKGDPATAKVEAHALGRDFDQATATWRGATTTMPWSSPGGDLDPTAVATVTGIDATPAWRSWAVGGLVQRWTDDPTSNHGLALRLQDGVPAALMLFAASEAIDPALRPRLVVTYTEKTAEDTYYVADNSADELAPASQYTIPVTVNNPTSAAWKASDWALSYRWKLPDGTDVSTAANQLTTALPKDLKPDEPVTVNATVKTPDDADSDEQRTDYVLGWELRNKTTGAWLSSSGAIEPFNQTSTVEKPSSNQLGLEHFYRYAPMATGAGSTAQVNLHSGNLVWNYDAYSNPSRGVSTSVQLAYNSLDTSSSAIGHGWSLGTSTLDRLGTPLKFQSKSDWPEKITLTDADGTSHTFTLNKHGAKDKAKWDYDHPPGVHLYLQKNPGNDKNRAWVMTKPGRAQIFFDSAGYQTALVDNNGNQLLFTYEKRKSHNKTTKFLKYVTDPAGRRTLTLAYYTKADVTPLNNDTSPVVDLLKSVTDVDGRVTTFQYSKQGLLSVLTDGAGSAQPKVFRFRYNTMSANKSTKLIGVTDPRGNSSSIGYLGSGKFKGRAQTLTDRLTDAATIGYAAPDSKTVKATATDALGHTTTYLLDSRGRPTSVTDAQNHTTALTWDADNNVAQLKEPNNAITTAKYDPNTGSPLETRDAEANAHGTPSTVLTYRTGLNGHVADLVKKTTAEGRTWIFTYDTVGDLTSVTDPAGTATPVDGDFTSTYTYDPFGQLLTRTDANQHTTSFGDYDPSGQPRTSTDALQHTTTTGYDARGNAIQVTDARGKTSTGNYDLFSRQLDTKLPKDQAAGVFIATPAPEYDANGNVVRATTANGAVTTITYDAVDQTIRVQSPKDTDTGPDRVTTLEYDKVGNLVRQTAPNGNLTPADPNDFVTGYAFDEVNRLASTTDPTGGRTSYTYDPAGNVVTIVDPRKNATPDPNDFTTKREYDLDHMVAATVDAAGNRATIEYDKDGNVVAQTDEENNRTILTLDPRGLVTEVKVPQDNAGGTIAYRTTRYEYDQVGNRTRAVSPNGVATPNPDDFAQSTVYDELDRVKEQVLPFNPADPQFSTPDRVVNSYDEVGHLTKVSGPPSGGQTIRNDTTYTYFDTGWIASSTDPFHIVDSYDYDPLGNQTRRTLTSADGTSSRAVNSTYFPDGKPRTRADTGSPSAQIPLVVDNSDPGASAEGPWETHTDGTGFQGADYRTHPKADGILDAFTWKVKAPADSDFELFVRYPSVPGAATNSTFLVSDFGTDGSITNLADVVVDQTQRGGEWVSLGTFHFGRDHTIGVSLLNNRGPNGTMVADAFKAERRPAPDPGATQAKSFSYSYDADGNLTTVNDASSDTTVDTDILTYTQLDQLASVEERHQGAVLNRTGYTYDPNGNVNVLDHNGHVTGYEYDLRDLVSKVTNPRSGPELTDKATTYLYTPRQQVLREAKANGNTVDYTYFLDGLVHTQTEKQANGTLVSDHSLGYDLNGNRAFDTSHVMNADNHSTYLGRNGSYFYDPRDRIASVVKSDTNTGSVVTDERYEHDANNNVTHEVLNGRSFTHTFDRNRLVQTESHSVSGGTDPPVTTAYSYDPFGRLTEASNQLADDQYTYDGFDRMVEARHQNLQPPVSSAVTQLAYDSLDRTTKRTENVGQPAQRTVGYDYLGLSNLAASELISNGATTTYEYGRGGDRLDQVKQFGEVEQENAFYSSNAHTDVESITDDSGLTKATYGYTAYGKDDSALYTGLDKPDPNDPGKPPYNVYRFNAKPLTPATGTYDMGFRDYSPAQNQFLTRDSYGSADADLGLATNPGLMNRYAFAGGNPVGGIEIDGHCWDWLQSTCNAVSGWVDGAVDATVSPVRDYVANLFGAGAGIACPSTVGYGNAGACGGVNESVKNDVERKTQIHVPLGADTHSTEYKTGHFIGEITGIPLPSGAAVAGESLAARLALRGASRKSQVAAQLLDRVTQLHGLLHERAQASRTTAIIRAWTGREFKDIVATSGDRPLDSKIQNALKGTEEVATNIKGMDAEANALTHILDKGWTPVAGASSRPICPWCQNFIFDKGAILLMDVEKETAILNRFRRNPPDPVTGKPGGPLMGPLKFIFG